MSYPQQTEEVPDWGRSDQPMPSPMVQQQSSNVGNEIRGLTEDVQRLHERLAPVLGGDTPHALGKDTADRAPFSPLASELEGYAMQLASVRTVLAKLLARLEV